MTNSKMKKRFGTQHTSTRASVLRLGDNVGLTPLAANTSSGVLQEIRRSKQSIVIGKSKDSDRKLT